jgi:predicted small integral membrane protein
MAWTWQTAAFFAFVIACLIGMTVWELRSPGGAPRHGILGLDTTRGDRLFIFAGSAYIFLARLALRTRLGAMGLSLAHCFRVFAGLRGGQGSMLRSCSILSLSELRTRVCWPSTPVLRCTGNSRWRARPWRQEGHSNHQGAFPIDQSFACTNGMKKLTT